MPGLEQRVADLERALRDAERELHKLKAIHAVPGMRLVLNDTFNVVDWHRRFLSHKHDESGAVI